MSLITRMRKQNAIYWPPATPDDYGRLAVGPPVALVSGDGTADCVCSDTLTWGDGAPLTFDPPPAVPGNYRVRWEDVVKEFIDMKGTVQMSAAVVYVPKLPDGTEVAVGGWLWLGDRPGLTSETDPRANAGAREIKRVDKLPNLKNTELLRTCYL